MSRAVVPVCTASGPALLKPAATVDHGGELGSDSGHQRLEDHLDHALESVRVLVGVGRKVIFQRGYEVHQA
jgi:hypothetical protein